DAVGADLFQLVAGQADSREQVFGIGPGVMYSQGRQTLFANLYAESGARNRSEGNQLTLRYLLAF
ncbi:transporter, partial [Pseudomonas aeruginosa]